jgi:hypothetical protein
MYMLPSPGTARWVLWSLVATGMAISTIFMLLSILKKDCFITCNITMYDIK